MTRADRWSLALILSTFLLLTVAGPLAAKSDCRTIEDFSTAKVGELPGDWKLRKDSGKEVYRTAEESGLRFLRATAKGLGVQVAKEYEWDLGAYPMLVWSWRLLEFPKGGDARESTTTDSPLAVRMRVGYSSRGGRTAATSTAVARA